jgi:hypothetical protein
MTNPTMNAYASADPLAALSSIAAEFLGPIADLLTQRLIGSNASFVKMREALAEQIDNPQARQRFREKTLPLLGAGWAATPGGSAAAASARSGKPVAVFKPQPSLPQREPQLLRQLVEELQPHFGERAAHIVAEHSSRSNTRVQLFLKLAKLLPEETATRRALETRALSDHRQRLAS